jgi:tetratricopeptide (TPR) repeat protein
MNIEELAKLLQGKRRSISDLIRFLSTRTDNTPNYTVFVGAGCSKTSGIRTASELITEWRNELCPELKDADAQRRYLKDNHGDWYDPNREYSSLFEKKYDLQRQRRMFVEKEVSGKTPSLGYAYLASLVGQNYFNTIFTTNFDDLINEAFYLYSDQRPIVCAHDSSINSITVTSKRPKLIKLHGDYLFDDLKSTARETESLEQNMKAKFAEFAKDFGLLVAGYSGSDRSIMDCISLLLKNDDYFKGGIYWCIQKGSEVSEELRKLLWKEKVYFVIVDGFDELFAELFSTLNNGDVLPISTLSVTRRPTQIANKLIQSQESSKTDSPILKRAIEQLVSQSRRTTLVSMILPSDKGQASTEANKALSDDDLITQIEIQNLIKSGNYHEAIKKVRSALKGVAAGRVAKRQLLRLAIDAHEAAGEIGEAIAVADELIALEPYRASHHLLKARLLSDPDQSLIEIEKAIACNPHLEDPYFSKSRWYCRDAESKHGDKKRASIEAALSAVDLGLIKDPSLANACWSLKAELIERFERDKTARESKLRNIIDFLSQMNPQSLLVFSTRLRLLSEQSTKTSIDQFIHDVEQAKARTDPSRSASYDDLVLNALACTSETQRISDAVVLAQDSHDLAHENELAKTIARIKRSKLGLDSEAADILKARLAVDFDPSAVEILITIQVDLDRCDAAESTLNQWSNKLAAGVRARLKVELLEARGDFEGALAEVLRTPLHSMPNRNIQQMYLLLRKQDYVQAEKLGREILAAINFSAEAAEETVNYELACKNVKGKVNSNRLEAVLQYNDSSHTKAAVFALLGRRRDMLDSIRTEMARDKAFRFVAKRWPVFADIRDDPEFMRALSIDHRAKPLSVVQVPDTHESPAKVAEV